MLTVPMKIIIAPDSFKESLSATRVAHAIAAGVRRAAPDAHCVLLPMADGGEGTVDAMVAGAAHAEKRCSTVCGPDGVPVQAAWGWLGEGNAVVETAAAAGLGLVAPAQRNALTATTYGVGEHILAAIDAGACRIVLGLGGSATTDGGAGMLQALGVRLLDAQGHELPPGGAALAHLHRLNADGLDPRLAHVQFVLASDVDNPLCGPHGAAAVFGPQKGATPQQVKMLDDTLAHFADVCSQTLRHSGRSPAGPEQPGAGAAGGLGFAALAFLNARFEAGVEVVAQACGLHQAVRGADLLFTGEGRLDDQTLRGKTAAGVARIARGEGVPVVALAGSLACGYQALYDAGIAAAFSLAPGPVDLAYALQHAERLLSDRACDIMRLWLARPRAT